MAGGAAFEPYRSVLECERPALVAVAIQASRLVRREGLGHPRTHAAVRIVAIDAAHRALGQLVMIGPLKLSPHVEMATRAQLIDRRRLAYHQSVRPVRMNF